MFTLKFNIMIVGICPKCSVYSELITHLFNSKEVPCLCKECEEEVLEEMEEPTFEMKITDLLNPNQLTLSL